MANNIDMEIWADDVQIVDVSVETGTFVPGDVVYGDTLSGNGTASAPLNVAPEIIEKIDNNAAAIVECQSNIDAESAARASADNELRAAITAEESARIADDETLQSNIDAESAARESADTTLQGNIDAEAAAREAADNALQSQIDAIAAASDVTDIVGTHAELEAYDTATLHANDIIKVLRDETQDDATTYYRWVITDDTAGFELIGDEGPYYTRAQTDELLNDKQDTLTAGDGIVIEDNVISAGDFVPQYNEMPAATADNVGEIAQYIGGTTTDYTHGYIYESKLVYSDATATIAQTVGGDSFSFETTAGDIEVTTTGAKFRRLENDYFTNWNFKNDGTLTLTKREGDWEVRFDHEIFHTEIGAADEIVRTYFDITGTPNAGDIVVCTFALGGMWNVSVDAQAFVDAEKQTEAGTATFTCKSVTAHLAETTFNLDTIRVTITDESAFVSAFEASRGRPLTHNDSFALRVRKSSENGRTTWFVLSDLFLSPIEDLAAWGISTDGEVTSEDTFFYAALTPLTFDVEWEKTGGSTVDVAKYGITYDGAPAANDVLTVTYDVTLGYAWAQLNVQPAGATGIKWVASVDLPAEYAGDVFNAAPYWTIPGGLPDGTYEYYFATKGTTNGSGDGYPIGDVIFKVRMTIDNANNRARGLMGYVFDGDYMNDGNDIWAGNTWWTVVYKNGNDFILRCRERPFASSVLAYNGHAAVPDCFRMSAWVNVETGDEYTPVGAINNDNADPTYDTVMDSAIQLREIQPTPNIPCAASGVTQDVTVLGTQTFVFSGRLVGAMINVTCDNGEFVARWNGRGTNDVTPYSYEIIRATGIFANCYLAYSRDNVWLMGVDTATAATLSGNVYCTLGQVSDREDANIWVDPIPAGTLTPIAQTGPTGYRLGTITAGGIGNIVQYTGATTDDYTNGYFYKATGTTVDVPASITFGSFSPGDCTVTVDDADALVTALNNVGGWGEDTVREWLTNSWHGFNVQYDFDTGEVTRVWWSNWGDIYDNPELFALFTVSTTGEYSGSVAISFDCNAGYKPARKGATDTAWERVDVQPGGGAEYTAGKGIAISDDGEISVADPVLVNTVPTEFKAYSTAINTTNADRAGESCTYIDAYLFSRRQRGMVCIGGDSYIGSYDVLVGRGVSVEYSGYSVYIGYRAGTRNTSSKNRADHAIAIGYRACVAAEGAIQIGSSTYEKDNDDGYIINSDANTFKVANANGNFEIMSADGTIPVERFTAVPETAGTYSATITVDGDGNITRSWETAASGAVDSVNGQTGTVELTAADVNALPLTGGTMTGALAFKNESWSGGVLGGYSTGGIVFGSIVNGANVLHARIDANGFIPSTDATLYLGANNLRWQKVYANYTHTRYINNGADITVPATAGTMVVATPPTDDGTYVLKATVADGVVTTAWVAE